MKQAGPPWKRLWSCFALLGWLGQVGWVSAADSLSWRQDQNRVDAEITRWDLPKLLENLAAATGWHIYLEPGSKHAVSIKFKDRLPNEALRLLLGDLSFALLPQTNGSPKLYVFRTSLQEATQLIRPVGKKIDPTAKPIPNELVVTLKPGANIDELAKKLGAKVLGRAKGSNTFRLGFDTADAAQSAREELQNNPEVESVDSNYYMRRPDPLDAAAYSSSAPPSLTPKAPAADCNHPIIGLIDTALQPTGGNLDAFLLPSIAVAGEARLPEDTPTHGTSMFETVLRGLSFSSKESTAKVLPVDVYGANLTTTTFDVANGVLQAVNGGANAINMSLGSGGDSKFLHDVIKQSQKQGILFFAAAGNEPGTAPSYPAAYPEVLAVTAGTRDGSIAPYANRGDFVDLAAPGSSIVNFKGKPWVVMGTSAATAYATGLAASMIDCENRSAAQIAAAMQALLPFQK